MCVVISLCNHMPSQQCRVGGDGVVLPSDSTCLDCSPWIDHGLPNKLKHYTQVTLCWFLKCEFLY